MAVIIQLRRDIASNWTAANPLLAQGEVGFELDTYRLKIGDGVTHWNSLAYYGDVTFAANIGIGIGLFDSKVVNTLQFKSLIGAGSVEVVSGTDTITISGTGGAGSFLELYDTPSTYGGYANNYVQVNSSGTGLIFTTITGVSGTSDHSELYNLDFESSGHTGFVSTAMLTTTSGDIVAQIPSLDEYATKDYVNDLVDLACGGVNGEHPIVSGSSYTIVSFDHPLITDEYRVLVNLKNEVDSIPSVYGYTVGKTTVSGFKVIYSGEIDSDNYTLVWAVSSGSCSNYYTKEEVQALIGNNKTGVYNLSEGVSSASVSFSTAFDNDDYKLFYSLENAVDSPASEYAITTINKTTSGFTVKFSGEIDSNNYTLDWFATTSGVGGAVGILSIKEDMSPELGGDLYINSYGLDMDTTPSGNFIHGYTIGYSGEISKMYVDQNDVGFGAALYMKSNGHWGMCTAVSGTTSMPCGALALEEGTGLKKILWRGIARKETVWSWTPGNVLYVSSVNGALTSTMPTGSGVWQQPVGFAISSDSIRFDPGYYPGIIV